MSNGLLVKAIEKIPDRIRVLSRGRIVVEKEVHNLGDPLDLTKGLIRFGLSLVPGEYCAMTIAVMVPRNGDDQEYTLVVADCPDGLRGCAPGIWEAHRAGGVARYEPEKSGK